MAYIGREPIIGNFQVCDAISVVNGQAAYTMQVSSVNVIPETANHMLVSLNGVLQKPGSSFTVSGSTITFASNLVTGDVIDFIQILGSVLDLGVPSDATVSTAKIVDGAVTSAKLASGTGGKIGQVVSTTKTDTWSSSGTGNFQAVTGLSVAITPSATSSKVYVNVDLTGYFNDYGGGFSIYRGGSAIVAPDSPSSRSIVNAGQHTPGAAYTSAFGHSFLDSPSSTSALTYQVYVFARSGTYYINRSSTDSDTSDYVRTVSTITAFEVLT